MNTNSLQYNNAINQDAEFSGLPKSGLFSGIITRVNTLFARARIERTRAWYRTKHQHQAKNGVERDIVRSLPMEEKLRLGMYRFMD